MNQYEEYANEIAARIKELHGRVERFKAHPTLHRRVPGVQAEIDKLTVRLPKVVATAKWSKELYSTWEKRRQQ